MNPILIVDDERDNLEALQRLLRSQFEVTTAESPLEALKLIQKKSFHVIVSDQRMPEMTGVQLLEKSRKLSPHSTRILLTGYTDIESTIEAINRGNIYRYIAKPWDPEELKLTIRQADEAFLLRSEIQEKNIQLERALHELTAVDRAKARFLSLVSHELNTPLTILNSFSELLNQTKSDLPSEMKKAVLSIREATERFSEIITDVVSFVRVESETLNEKTDFDLAEELRKIITAQFSETSKKHLKISLRAPQSSEASSKVRADAPKMRLALGKLFSDAVHRAPPATQIEFTFKHSPASLTLVLSRTGEPLDTDAFKPLESGQSLMHHQKNLGLSLALAKQVIDRHGGTICAETHPSGKQDVLIVFPIDE